MKLLKKKKLVQKRRWRIRGKVTGTAQRPRLNVRFSQQHIYAQCIDDREGTTLAAVNTTQKDATGTKPNVEGATAMGKLMAEKAKAAGITSVVFDRGGRRYHGCVQAFATAAREGGLTF